MVQSLPLTSKHLRRILTELNFTSTFRRLVTSAVAAAALVAQTLGNYLLTMQAIGEAVYQPLSMSRWPGVLKQTILATLARGPAVAVAVVQASLNCTSTSRATFVVAGESP